MPRDIYTRRVRLNTFVRSIAFVIGPGIAYIPLSRQRFSLIEVDDAHLVVGENWCTLQHHQPGLYYAVRRERGSGKYKLMHRVIMGDPNCEVDHANGNGLDNRRNGNLREATPTQNRINAKLRSDNTTGYKGVSYAPNGRRKKFCAGIQRDGKRHVIGYYLTAEAAHAAYCAKAKELYGEFARFK
jgi:hypothetical protein